jgi:hypothetical protein
VRRRASLYKTGIQVFELAPFFRFASVSCLFIAGYESCGRSGRWTGRPEFTHKMTGDRRKSAPSPRPPGNARLHSDGGWESARR